MASIETSVEQAPPPSLARLVIMSGSDIVVEKLLSITLDSREAGINAGDLVAALTDAPGDWRNKRLLLLTDIPNNSGELDDQDQPNVTDELDDPALVYEPLIAFGETISFTDGRIILNDAAHQVTVDRQPTKLSRKEYGTLRVFASNVGRLITQQNLIDLVWDGRPEVKLNNVRCQINALRRKLGPELGDPKLGALRTVNRMGWLLVDSLSEETA